MSLKPALIQPVPDETARIAKAAFRKGNPLLTLREELGTIFSDKDFTDLFAKLGQPGLPPWRLALITILQFRENLSDRQAAEAVRARIDWKYLLGLELADAGFDHSVLCEFRSRLLKGDAAERLLAKLLARCQALGLLKARGRQRNDATHVLAAIRVLNRLELVGETLRAALNELAAVAPEWLRSVALEAWSTRYAHRIEDARLPVTPAKRETYARQVGNDGFHLLDALAAAGTPEGLDQLSAVLTLRRVWARHFERVENEGDSPTGPGGVRLRVLQGRGDDRIESPYDVDARFRTKGGMGWTGYMVHLTETCDEDAPRLVIHVDTTPAIVHEAMRIDAIHVALGTKGLAPSEHLVDAGYVSAGHLVGARERHGIALVGPTRKEASWQRRTGGAFGIDAFVVDWESKRVRCPEGKESTSWGEYKNEARGRFIRARFRPTDCHACPSKALCTRTTRKRQGRQLTLHAREERKALEAAKVRQSTAAGRQFRALRQGIESTISQGVRVFGLRRARYRRLVKTHLQHVATAAALDLNRVVAWLEGRPLAPTRISRFAATAA
jgi:transposase